MKLLSILLLVGFISSIIYWAFTAGGPVYMKDFNGRLRMIPGVKPNWFAILVALIILAYGIYDILIH